MDVLEILRDNEKVMRERFGIARVGVFGSFVRHEERRDSDVDILVEFEQGKKNF
jgi:predicted nucleotidyltransferase